MTMLWSTKGSVLGLFSISTWMTNRFDSDRRHQLSASTHWVLVCCRVLRVTNIQMVLAPAYRHLFCCVKGLFMIITSF